MKLRLDWLLDVPSMDDNINGDYPCLLMIKQANTNDVFVGFMLSTKMILRWKLTQYHLGSKHKFHRKVIRPYLSYH